MEPGRVVGYGAPTGDGARPCATGRTSRWSAASWRAESSHPL